MQEFILDDPGTELIFQELLKKIKTLKNGITVESMVKRGIIYKVNYGASVISLQNLAAGYQKNHLLAFKLWNKQWRESMILATLLEEPEKVTPNQMDFWVKNFPSVEIAEQAVMNLLCKTGFAFEKAYEYCLGKKTITKITGLLMISRLAINEKEAPDEKFDPFFEVMPPLSRDPRLSASFVRAYSQLGMRNPTLRHITLQHTNNLKTILSESANINAEEIIHHLS